MRNYGKRTKRYIKRRRARRPLYKKRYSAGITVFNRANRRFPLPTKFKMRLRYVTQVSTNSTGGLVGHVFSANGLYDPDVTGTGHQPLGFDQVMPMYQHYTVIGARIQIVSYNYDGTYPQIAGIKVSGSETVETDYAKSFENGNVVWKTLNKNATGGEIKTLTAYVSIGKFMGRHNILSEDDFRGTDSANPDEQVYFHVFSMPHSFGSDPEAVIHKVTIDYIAVFTEPKDLASS